MDTADARRTLFAGLAGGLSLNVAMLVTFRLLGFGLDGDGILLDPAHQSDKLIAVWTELEPLPLVVVDPVPILVGLLGFGVLHAVVYRSVAPSWPDGVAARGLRFGGLLFVVGYAFWEFFTPVNLFGEPLLLVALELVFWGTIALAEGLTIAAVFESGTPYGTGDRTVEAS